MNRFQKIKLVWKKWTSLIEWRWFEKKWTSLKKFELVYK